MGTDSLKENVTLESFIGGVTSSLHIKPAKQDLKS